MTIYIFYLNIQRGDTDRKLLIFPKIVTISKNYYISIKIAEIGKLNIIILRIFSSL